MGNVIFLLLHLTIPNAIFNGECYLPKAFFLSGHTKYYFLWDILSSCSSHLTIQNVIFYGKCYLPVITPDHTKCYFLWEMLSSCYYTSTPDHTIWNFLWEMLSSCYYKLPYQMLWKISNSISLFFSHWRESQLNLQIPKQDISIKYCSHVDLPHQVHCNTG